MSDKDTQFPWGVSKDMTYVPTKEFQAMKAELEALRAANNPVEPKCPCGTAYLRVEGGYVPMCTCAAKNTVALEP